MFSAHGQQIGKEHFQDRGAVVALAQCVAADDGNALTVRVWGAANIHHAGPAATTQAGARNAAVRAILVRVHLCLHHRRESPVVQRAAEADDLQRLHLDTVVLDDGFNKQIRHISCTGMMPLDVERRAALVNDCGRDQLCVPLQ